ncbi:MAG: biotin/lipoyl-containing protein, partial [Acidobacteriota bacterium]
MGAFVQDLKLPELGENIDAVEVSAVLVAVGDSVKRDQPVIEVETEKASLEVPAPSDGKVTELLVSKGDQIKVGQVVLRLETAITETIPEAPAAAAEAPTAAPALLEQDDAPVVTFPAKHKPMIGLAVPAAPSARALARQLGVDINEVPGRG